MTDKRAERVQELRRSNAAGSHQDRRTKRLRTRSDQERSAINDGANQDGAIQDDALADGTEEDDESDS